MKVRILAIGDVVGKPGRSIIVNRIGEYCRKELVDCVIANGENLAGGSGLMPAEADGLVFWVAPLLVVLAAFTVFIVVPFGPTHAVTDMNIGILFMLGALADVVSCDHDWTCAITSIAAASVVTRIVKIASQHGILSHGSLNQARNILSKCTACRP